MEGIPIVQLPTPSPMVQNANLILGRDKKQVIEHILLSSLMEILLLLLFALGSRHSCHNVWLLTLVVAACVACPFLATVMMDGNAVLLVEQTGPRPVGVVCFLQILRCR